MCGPNAPRRGHPAIVTNDSELHTLALCTGRQRKQKERVPSMVDNDSDIHTERDALVVFSDIKTTAKGGKITRANLS